MSQDLVAERAQGTYIYTTDGQKHLDMAAGRTLGLAQSSPCIGEYSLLS